MKTCTGCGKIKDLDDFHRNSSSKSGYLAGCKECRKIYRREYFQKNRRKIIEQSRVYQQSGGTPRSFVTRCLNSARQKTLRKGRLFTVTPEHILALREKQNNKCAYLGTEMIWRPKSGIYKMSIDRIDSSKGYIPSNCQLVCDGINRLKSDATDKDFVYLLKFLTRPPPDNSVPVVPYSDFSSAEKRKFTQNFNCMTRRNIIRRITREDLHRLREKYQDRCALTGIRVTWEPNQITTASWDRIDSEGNYTMDNIQLTSWPVNAMKGPHLNDDAIGMIGQIREVYGEIAFDL